MRLPLLAVVLPLGLAGCAGRRAAPDWCAQAGPVTLPTADGAAIRLHHHPADGPPVLVVHGIAASARYFDLTAERSLALALNAAGYDAWLLDLRGHGEATEDATGRPLRPGWSIDDYGRYDVAAAIDGIRAATGAPRVAYVGHSMGGMVAAVYTAWHGDDALSSLTVLGSPLSFDDPDPALVLGRRAMALGTVPGHVPVPVLARGLAGVRELPFQGDDLLFAADNVDEPTRRAMYRHATSAFSRGELRHFQRILGSGSFSSVDGSRDYVAALAELRVPLLAIAGRGDHIAPPDRVRPWVDRAGSEEVRWEVLGRANGYRHDYGHVDMTMGIDAPTEVWPMIIDFIGDHP